MPLESADFYGDGVADLAIVTYTGSTVALMLADTVSSPYLGAFDLRTQDAAFETMDLMTSTRAQLAESQSKVGALQSRLATAANNSAIARENVTTAYSRIADADVAQESAALVRSRILQQASAAVLVQANAESELVLSLI